MVGPRLGADAAPAREQVTPGPEPMMWYVERVSDVVLDGDARAPRSGHGAVGTLVAPLLILSANSLIFASYGLIAGFDVA